MSKVWISAVLGKAVVEQDDRYESVTVEDSGNWQACTINDLHQLLALDPTTRDLELKFERALIIEMLIHNWKCYCTTILVLMSLDSRFTDELRYKAAETAARNLKNSTIAESVCSRLLSAPFPQVASFTDMPRVISVRKFLLRILRLQFGARIAVAAWGSIQATLEEHPKKIADLRELFIDCGALAALARAGQEGNLRYFDRWHKKNQAGLSHLLTGPAVNILRAWRSDIHAILQQESKNKTRSIPTSVAIRHSSLKDFLAQMSVRYEFGLELFLSPIPQEKTQNISILKVGKISAFVHTGIAAVFSPLLLIAFSAVGIVKEYLAIIIVLLPFFSPMVGFCLGVGGAYIYNLIAKPAFGSDKDNRSDTDDLGRVRERERKRELERLAILGWSH